MDDLICIQSIWWVIAIKHVMVGSYDRILYVCSALAAGSAFYSVDSTGPTYAILSVLKQFAIRIILYVFDDELVSKVYFEFCVSIIP